mmetsp:Transcript_27688/g.66694  ORF Transcript_27688/g.66694 Transcript_27688/m.66694 type:complete len:1242 (+) Transcript_27688:257-3982(+)
MLSSSAAAATGAAKSASKAAMKRSVATTTRRILTLNATGRHRPFVTSNSINRLSSSRSSIRGVHPSIATAAASAGGRSFSSDDRNNPPPKSPPNPESLIPGSTSQSPYGSLGEPARPWPPTSPHADPSASKSSSSSIDDFVFDPSRAQAWQAQTHLDVQRVTQNAMIYELQQQQTQTISRVVPWFLQNMPPSYFQQIPPSFRMDHIAAIAAVKDVANMDLYLNLKSQIHDGRTIYTFIRPSTAPGTLLSMVEELPFHTDGGSGSGNDGGVGGGGGEHQLPQNLSRLHVFSSKDNSMSLNMFIYGESPQRPRTLNGSNTEPIQHILDFARDVQEGKHSKPLEDGGLGLQPNSLFEKQALLPYLSKCSDNYLNIVSQYPERFLRQRLLYESVSGTEGCEVHIEEAIHEQDQQYGSDVDGPTGGYYWLDIAMANSLPQIALEHTCRLLYMQGFDVSRARLDIIPDGDNGSVTMLRLLIHPVRKCEGENDTDCQTGVNEHFAAAAENSKAASDTAKSGDSLLEQFNLLSYELKRSKWLDNATIKLVFEDYPWLGVRRAEIITAFCSLLHPIMAKQNAIVYSKHNIMQMVTHPRMIQHAAKIADVFLERFDPENPLRDETAFQARLEEIKAGIETDVEESSVSEVLYKMMDVIKHTVKTNIYMKDRYALSLRLDPIIMDETVVDEEHLPYGVVFVHGRRFNGFHVRFRDIARGGLRLVAPGSSEQLALESARQYDECYGLAFAQQLKNKDIPEGGSKAVCLIDTNEILHGTRDFVLRKSVKAFADSILDLIVDTPETRTGIVDYFGKPEVLYLGPDENVIPEDINWIIQQAARRGYNTPAAFMSSKPRAGINHKEYGVTSEGVNVYLDVALRATLGIDPKTQPFTVKMTGGPDGDVGGNEIKILIREYGDNAKIVGVADHSGCAEDPEGLDHDELLRLFHEGLCISNFDQAKLKTDGILHTVDTEEGVKARNSMHNRLKADAFLPCGGRPNTIDGNNFKHFIGPDGEPSSKLIVEGANLFNTAEARQKLYETAGVYIVKDSSANKGGVITSSYEICAAMLLSEDEFFEHKEAIVEEVLEKLRGLAKREAELLFRESNNYGESLPDVSKIISDAINAATDALSTALDTLSEEDQEQLLPLFRAHLPKTIADLSFDRVHERVPKQYIKNAIASTLASKMVYKEGTRFIEALPKKKLAETALKYIQKEKEVVQLMESLENSTMSEDEKRKVLELLDQGGARTALNLADM